MRKILYETTWIKFLFGINTLNHIIHCTILKEKFQRHETDRMGACFLKAMIQKQLSVPTDGVGNSVDLT